MLDSERRTDAANEHRTAFTDDVIAFIPALRAFGRSLTRNAEDADDLVQETLTKAINKSHLFTMGTNLRAWLFTIMRNTHNSNRVKRAREMPGTEDCVSGTLVTQPTQEWSLRGRELMAAVNSLPQHYRETLVLVVMLGESYEDSARICQCKVGTVKSRVARARSMVIDILENGA